MYVARILPEALKCLPLEFAERFTAKNNNPLGWKVENVTVDGLFHKLQTELSQCHQLQGIQENIIIEFVDTYPFQMRTAEEVYASVEDDPRRMDVTESTDSSSKSCPEGKDTLPAAFSFNPAQ